MDLLSTASSLRLLQAVSFLWAGIVLGISFLEAPGKFRAPTVTRAVGLDVGRHVFRVLNRVEWIFGAVVLALLVPASVGRAWQGVLAGIGIILVVQSLWLLPILRRQATAIIEQEKGSSDGYAHLGYVFLELLKVAGLLAVGWNSCPI